MPMPTPLAGRLRLPVIAAPMFLVSTPPLVIASCRNGVVGSFPALNHRTTEGFAGWLDEIETALAAPSDTPVAPYGVNLIVHNTNPRLGADLDVVADKKVPLVITSLGAVRQVIDTVQGYGGLVFHDVTTLRHAQKAVDAGVDGLILVSAGAGGHAGTVHPFALIEEVRRIFDGTVILSGALSTGAHVAGALAAGADLAYLGTRFINTVEAAASDAYKQMIVDTAAADVVYTDAISGIPANFLAPSLVQAGIDPHNPGEKPDIDLGEELDVSKAWKDIWSAGHGVGAIDDVPPVAELVDRLDRDFRTAVAALSKNWG